MANNCIAEPAGDIEKKFEENPNAFGEQKNEQDHIINDIVKYQEDTRKEAASILQDPRQMMRFLIVLMMLATNGCGIISAIQNKKDIFDEIMREYGKKFPKGMEIEGVSQIKEKLEPSDIGYTDYKKISYEKFREMQSLVESWLEKGYRVYIINGEYANDSYFVVLEEYEDKVINIRKITSGIVYPNDYVLTKISDLTDDNFSALDTALELCRAYIDEGVVKTDFDIEECKQYIISLAARVKEKVPNELDKINQGHILDRNGALNVIDAINQVLFAEEQFGYEKRTFLSDTINSKKGVCSDLSLVYYLIGEQLGLPIHIVVTPKHMFVRWNDEENYLNVETTCSGFVCSDEHYILTELISENNISDDGNLGELSKLEALCEFLLRFALNMNIKDPDFFDEDIKKIIFSPPQENSNHSVIFEHSMYPLLNNDKNNEISTIIRRFQYFSAKGLFLRGVAHSEDLGRNEEAIEYLEKALGMVDQLDTSTIEAIKYSLGVAHWNLDRYKKAAELFRQCLELLESKDKNSVKKIQAIDARAITLIRAYDSENSDKAKISQEMIEAVYDYLGLFDRSQWRKAHRRVEQIRTDFSKDPSVMICAGYSAIFHNITAAGAYFEVAVKVDPNNAHAEIGRIIAEAMSAKNNPNRSVELLETLRGKPINEIEAYIIATIYEKAGYIEEAVEYYEIAIKKCEGSKHRDIIQLKISLAKALIKSDPTRARKYLLEEISRHNDLRLMNLFLKRINPGDLSILLKKGKKLFSDGKYEQASEVLRKIIARKPNSREDTRCIAEAHLTLRNHEKAIEWYERTITKDKDRSNIRPYLDIIWAKYKLLRLDEAMRDIELFESEYGDLLNKEQQAELAATKAAIYKRNRDYKSAIEEYEKAIQLSPKKIKYLLFAADVCRLAGLDEKADEYVKRYRDAIRESK
jgi:tetratricopeptide (TPR) repeat protein